MVQLLHLYMTTGKPLTIQAFVSKEIASLFNTVSKFVMAPHSSALAWKIAWTEEPAGLQSMGSLRVGLD